MHALIDWLLNTIGSLGYPGIFLLMAMESSILPVPSELVMPPAGYLVQQGRMDMSLVILNGTFGSLAGAYINYYIARWLGRPLVIRYGRYVWIKEEHFDRVERFFHQHGEVSTFLGRLLPVIRHLISIPAGLARMNHFRFTLYTTVGAGIWVSTLAWIGYFIGAEKALISHYSHQAILGAILLSLFTLGIYIILHRRKLAQKK